MQLGRKLDEANVQHFQWSLELSDVHAMMSLLKRKTPPASKSLELISNTLLEPELLSVTHQMLF